MRFWDLDDELLRAFLYQHISGRCWEGECRNWDPRCVLGWRTEGKSAIHRFLMEDQGIVILN